MSQPACVKKEITPFPTANQGLSTAKHNSHHACVYPPVPTTTFVISSLTVNEEIKKPIKFVPGGHFTMALTKNAIASTCQATTVWILFLHLRDKLHMQ